MTDARLEFQPTYAGVHFARVSEWAHRYGDAYWYRLSVEGPTRYRRYLPIVMREAG
jgi:hypothetical protein